MANTIDYFFYGASPFTYFGHQHLQDVASKHGFTIAYKPIDLFAVWEVSGAVPPPKRPPVRQRYRLLELQRIAEMRGLPINLKPEFWPLDVSLCDGCATAIIATGHDPASFIGSVLSGVWAENANLADEGEVALRLKATGHDPAKIIEASTSDVVRALREANTKEAIAKDAVGVPAYVLNGEVFWGQDRLDHLDHALATGRPPFVA